MVIGRPPASMGIFQKKPRTAEHSAGYIKNIDPQICNEAERRRRAVTVVTTQSRYEAFTNIDGGGRPPMPIRSLAEMWPSGRSL